MNAKDFFTKQWGTGFIKATLSEKNGLLEMSMEDIYSTMESYAQQLHQQPKVEELEKIKKHFTEGGRMITHFDGKEEYILSKKDMDVIESLLNTPLKVEISDEDINQVEYDETQKHDWDSLTYKETYQEAFMYGAKWYRSQLRKRGEVVNNQNTENVERRRELLVCPNCNSLDITDRIFKKECLKCGQKFKVK